MAIASKARTTQRRWVSSEISLLFLPFESPPRITFVVYYDERSLKLGGGSPQISQWSTSQWARAPTG